MRQLFLMFLITAATMTVSGQNERKFVRSGNKLFMEAVKDTTKLDTAKFSQAEDYYRKDSNKIMVRRDRRWHFAAG